MKQILPLLFSLLLSLPAYADYLLTLSTSDITCEDGVGRTYQLRAFLNNLNASEKTEVTDSPDMTWTTSDSTVATVDRTGLVTIHADGEAIIGMTTDKYQLHNNGVDAICRVTSLPVGGPGSH